MKIEIDGLQFNAVRAQRESSSMALWFKWPAEKLWNLHRVKKAQKVVLSLPEGTKTAYLAGIEDTPDGYVVLQLLGIYDSQFVESEYPKGWRI